MVYIILLIIGIVFSLIGVVGSITIPVLIRIFGSTVYGQAYVNGVLVDSNAPISAYIFLIIPLTFLSIGVPMLIVAIRGKIKQHNLDKHGIEQFGVIVNIYESCVAINNRPELKADIYVVGDTMSINMYSTPIGFNWDLYAVGDYVQVKHYNGNIKVIGLASSDSIPLQIRELLDERAYRVRKNFKWEEHT